MSKIKNISNAIALNISCANISTNKANKKKGNEMTYHEAKKYIALSDLPDIVISQCMEVVNDFKSEFEPTACGVCNATGEAMWSDGICPICKGTGEIKEADYRNDYGEVEPIFAQLIQPFSPNKGA